MMRKGSFPTSRPPGITDRLTGAVTWFSTSKGFGFIKPVDGSDDVFVHVSVVQRAGLEGLREGATVTCEVAPGKKGRQVTRLLEVDDSTATAELGASSGSGPGGGGGGFRSGPPSGGGFGGPPRSRFGGGGGGFGGGGGYGGGGGFGGGGGGFGQGDEGEGVVKWFNATKGFGFITPNGGGKDVFLHASVVRRAGLMEVQPGQRVRYTSIERDKGPEARSVEVVADEADAPV